MKKVAKRGLFWAFMVLNLQSVTSDIDGKNATLFIKDVIFHVIFSESEFFGK